MRDAMICRTCTVDCKEYKLLHVEGLILGRVTTLADLLNFCTDLEFPEHECHLPAQICLDCLQKLAKSFVFKQMVIDANEALRHGYEDIKDGLMGQLLHDVPYTVEFEDTSEGQILEVIEVEQEDYECTGDLKTVTEPLLHNLDDVCESVDIEVGEELEYVTEHLEANDTTIVDDCVVEEIVEQQGQVQNDNAEMKEGFAGFSDNDDELESTNEDEEELYNPNDNNAKNQCPVCHKMMKNRKSYNLHMKRHDPFNPKACKFCGKVYRQLDTLRRHLLSHTGEKPLECEVCGRRFRFQSILTAHMRQHTGEKPFKCNYCDKVFGTRKHMKRHEMVHLSTESSYPCDICGKSFSQERYLDLHKMRHIGDKPYQCHLCGKSMAQQGTLKRHMLIHTGEKPFQCDLCDKNFRDIKTLKIHKLHHAGIKPFECPYCEKNFSTAAQLKIHTMLHTGETPHACRICGKSYRVARSLQRHMVVHSGERNHVCEVCGFKFRFESNLISHRHLHSRNDAKCPFCEKAFRTVKQRERHIALRHEAKEVPSELDEVDAALLTNSKRIQNQRRAPEIVHEKLAKSNIVMLY